MVVGGFVRLNDPRSYASRISHDRLILGDRPDKDQSKTLAWINQNKKITVLCLDMGYQSPTQEPGLSEGLVASAW